MRWSKTYIPTLREAPADADVISHKLLVRAGMIRKLTAGIYTWLPLGLLSLYRSGEIVRQEMNKAGAIEVLMPMVNPGDLWMETGRWEKYGKELLRFKDRHERDYCLGPTHEEVITDLLRGELRSYRQMPVNLYQIQTKFRDEIRPRFGLMRGREFVMKDAYSFDRDDEGANKSYEAMREAYNAVYQAMCLDYRMVEADSGAIGGNYSHEFMVVAETGEDDVATCPACNWASNKERAPLKIAMQQDNTPCPAMEGVDTPNEHTVESLCTFFKTTADKCLKTLLFVCDGQPVAVLLRGDHELNDVKLKHLLGVDTVEFAAPEQVKEWTGAELGFAGPVGLKKIEKLYADNALMGGNDWIAGLNETGKHAVHLSLPRDATLPIVWADLRNIQVGDPCPKCSTPVEMCRGIEVGHIFKLGLKYSEAMNATFLDEDGVEKLIVMGCYGIGVSRLVAAAIEQNNDESGIMFPPPLAPYDVHIINLDPKNADATAKADELDAYLNAQGLTTLYDDRDERPGVKFNDADLLGLPLQLIVGGNSLKSGVIETKNRRTGEKGTLPAADFASAFKACHQKMLDSWKR